MNLQGWRKKTDSISKKEIETLQIRCAEAERAMEDCNAAFEIIPIWALERGQTWVPSEVAIHLLRKAKDSITTYTRHHWHTGNGS
jgi:hypothetical protein